MNRFLNIAFCSLAFAFFVSPTFAHAAEIIHTFASDITVLPDSSLHIVESVTYDFGKTERHGIFRFIPTTHPEPATIWYKERYTDIAVKSVTRDGAPEQYVVTDEPARANIKVGNADKTIVGSHVYVITYDVRGGLSYPHQLPPEVYWNVSGGGWDVPLENVTATIHGAPGMFGKNRSCYKGNAGEGATCTMHATDTGAVFEAVGLAPGAQMTIAQDLADGAVPKVVLERSRVTPLILGLLSVPFALFALVVYIYRYQTKFKIDAPIIAQYEPYPGILPMYTGVLIDGKLDPKDISAAIVYLAEKRYIKIRKTEKKVMFLFEVDDYEITLLRSFVEELEQSQNVALGLLFENFATPGSVVCLSELHQMYTKQAENRKKIETLRTSVIDDLSSLGFYQKLSSSAVSDSISSSFTSIGHWAWWGILLIVYVLARSTQSLTFILVFWGAALLPRFVIVPLMLLSRRLTTKGYEAKNHLLGFKLFLAVTDEARFAFHDAPTKSPEQFMEYLPYAIALGVEKEWAKVFENITVPNPDWYDGGSVSAFSPIAFTSSLGAFSGALATSGGSVSASGGGGSAGGGGGGGGGGSW